MVDTEADFQELVAVWLSESFAAVDHAPTLDSGRRPDFVAHTPFRTYAIEVEDSSESLYRGVGQAGVYATELDAEPVVVFPADDAPAPASVPEWVTLVTV